MPTPPFRQLGDEAADEAPSLPTGRNLITVIGIDDYAHYTKLKNAVADAEAVRTLFTTHLGFQEMEGAASLVNEKATLDALPSFMRDQLPAELQPGDSLVIFYAGHATTVSSKVPDPEDAGKTIIRRTGYLIAVDARERMRCARF